MPGRSAGPELQAQAARMKWCRPGKSPKQGKIVRHFAHLAHRKRLSRGHSRYISEMRFLALVVAGSFLLLTMVEAGFAEVINRGGIIGCTQLPKSNDTLATLLSNSFSNKLNLDPHDAYAKAYDSFFKDGVELAKNPDTKNEAIESFAKAIKLYPQKATEKLFTLDDKVQPLYRQAMAKAGLQSAATGEKEKKGSILPWIIGGAVALAAGIYFLTKKSSSTAPTPPPPPANVTISLDAYNSTKGYQKDLTAKTVKSGSSVVVNISDTGVSNVDNKYIAVYRDDFKQKIAFGSAGSATFTAPSTSIKYHVILFDALGTNPIGQQVSYDWVSNASLQNSKRNHIVYRKDFDGQTMEERVWGGQSLPEIGGANGVFDQLNNDLVTNYTTWGHIDREPTATTGDFSYGAGNSDGNDGLHWGSSITVNAKKIGNDMIIQVAAGLEEAFENLLTVNDIGGNPSQLSIQSHGVANDDCRRLMLFAYIKDDASFTANNKNTMAMANAINMINVNKQLGPVNIGLKAGNINLGFNNKNLGVNTSLRMNGTGIENYTTANFTGEKFQAGFGMVNSQSQQAYNAQGTFKIDEVILLGVNGGYDAKTKQSNMALNVGAALGKDTNIMLGGAVTPGMIGFNFQATQALKDIGIIGFKGMYTKNSLVVSTDVRNFGALVSLFS